MSKKREEVILRRRKGEITRIKRAQARRKVRVRVGDPFHETFYDKDGSLVSNLEIRKQTIGARWVPDRQGSGFHRV